MGAGKDLARAKQAQRAAALGANVVDNTAPTTAEIEASVFGKDAPIATLLKWRGEIWSDLSWGQVVSIMQQAETTGATETWARLTRRMYQDGRILAVRGTRLDPISGADFDVTPGGPDPIDQMAADDVDAMLRSIPELPKALDGILDAVFVGWSVEEILWTTKGAWVWPSRLDIIEPHRFRFTETIEPYLYDDGRLGTDPGANPSIRLNGRPLRADKYIVHMPRVLPDYPIASGLLRACARYWWPKWMAAQYWLGGAEVAGNPRAIGKYPQGTPTNVRQAFFDQLQSLRANGAMVIPSDSDVQIVNPSAQGSGSVWTGIAEWCDTGITLTVLGSELNTEGGVGGGNRALGESQGSYTIDPRLVKDSSSMWSTIKRDLVTPFLRFNMWRYGNRMPAIPDIESRFAEELEPQVDDLIVSVGGVTVNDVRKSRGHGEWTAEQGGEAIAAREGAPPAEATAVMGATSVAAVADTALNGAQIASLMELLSSVNSRTLAPEAAVVAIKRSFPSIPEADARAMVAAQAALPPPLVEGAAAPPPAAMSAQPQPRTDPAKGEVWIDTADGHRLEVVQVSDSTIWFVDLDDPNPARQWTWARSHFIERTKAPEEVPASAPAGSLGQADAETTYASGGTPAVRPLAPWDLVDQMSREAE